MMVLKKAVDALIGAPQQVTDAKKRVTMAVDDLLKALEGDREDRIPAKKNGHHYPNGGKGD